jgi:hypothetical protein
VLTNDKDNKLLLKTVLRGLLISQLISDPAVREKLQKFIFKKQKINIIQINSENKNVFVHAYVWISAEFVKQRRRKKVASFIMPSGICLRLFV